jgi:hypothetical protein
MEIILNHIDHYSVKLGIIKSIPDERILLPASMPVRVYLQEAENLYSWCQADKEKLAANGLNWSLVEDMPARIDTLREAQARWAASDIRENEIEKQWFEKSTAAREFRKCLVRSIKFMFRDNPSVISMISRLGEGESSAALIQSLRNISVFGREQIEFPDAVNFNMTALDTAGELSRELASLLGAVNSVRASYSSSLKLRNQAYTYLREAVTELKKHADFIFWRDPARLNGYSSGYIRKRNIKHRNKKALEEAGKVII